MSLESEGLESTNSSDDPNDDRVLRLSDSDFDALPSRKTTFFLQTQSQQEVVESGWRCHVFRKQISGCWTLITHYYTR